MDFTEIKFKKSSNTLFSQDPLVHCTQLNLLINNQTIPNIKNSTLAFKPTFNEHTKNVKATANKSLIIIIVEHIMCYSAATCKKHHTALYNNILIIIY